MNLLFCSLLSLVIELSNTLTFAPKPIAVLAGIRQQFPHLKWLLLWEEHQLCYQRCPLPNSVVIISSAAINIDAVPAISLGFYGVSAIFVFDMLEC
jgi:hypothetical protein